MNKIKIFTASGASELQKDINEFFEYLERAECDVEIVQFTETPMSYTAYIIYTENN